MASPKFSIGDIHEQRPNQKGIIPLHFYSNNFYRLITGVFIHSMAKNFTYNKLNFTYNDPNKPLLSIYTKLVVLELFLKETVGSLDHDIGKNLGLLHIDNDPAKFNITYDDDFTTELEKLWGWAIEYISKTKTEVVSKIASSRKFVG